MSLEVTKFFFFVFWYAAVCLHSFQSGLDAASFVCLRIVALVRDNLESVSRTYRTCSAPSLSSSIVNRISVKS